MKRTIAVIFIVILMSGCTQDIPDNTVPDVPDISLSEIDNYNLFQPVRTSEYDTIIDKETTLDAPLPSATLDLIANTSQIIDYEYTIIGDCVTITKYLGSSQYVIIPEMIDEKKVTAIGSASYGFGVFDGNRYIKNVVIPESVEEIGNRAFANCDYLSIVKIPESVTTIWDYAFFNCWSLTELNIPHNVNHIGTYSLTGCSSLTKITVDKNNEAFTDIDGVLFNKNKTKLILYPAKKNDRNSYNISSGVIEVAEFAFRFNNSLRSITMPKSVSIIGGWAFRNCNSLSSITIPPNVIIIGEYAFADCYALSRIYIPVGISILDSVLLNSNPTVYWTEPEFYNVELGNTLYGIAKMYGISIWDLQAVNNIQNPNLIYAGQLIVIPDVFVVTVKPGDTLGRYAKENNSTVQELQFINKIENPDLIYVGQRIVLPIGKNYDPE